MRLWNSLRLAWLGAGVTTYYIRHKLSGEIINACETQSKERAEEVCETISQGMGGLDGFYPDPNPPLEVLKRYRYWDERP